MNLSSGTKLGPYEIIAPIGAGGMGEVYRARDTRLDRDVAIKFSREQCSERFEREAIMPARVGEMVIVGELSASPADPSALFASPKSSTFTVPSGVILMLAGFRSRWTIPFACAISRAAAICRAIFRTSSRGSGPRGSRSIQAGWNFAETLFLSWMTSTEMSSRETDVSIFL